jgi:hypothetical protein
VAVAQPARRPMRFCLAYAPMLPMIPSRDPGLSREYVSVCVRVAVAQSQSL